MNSGSPNWPGSRVHAGLRQPRRQPAAAAGAARRHHRGGCLSVAHPAPLRRPGAVRAARARGSTSCSRMAAWPRRTASRARTRSSPARPAASSAPRAPQAMAGIDAIIGFDMGGTSTDVALYAGGFERAFETAVAGVRMRAPMMAINTVAAGGGSILHFDGARMRVGPDCAGADPGPGVLPARRAADGDRCECVRGQDPAAHFPPIFGPRGDQPLDPGAVADEIRRTGRRRSSARPAGRRSRWQRGFCKSPSPTWRTRSSRSRCRRATTSPASRCSASAGRAGSMPAWSPTRWGWRRCSSTPIAGVLSAYGMGLADQTAMREQAVEIAAVRRGACRTAGRPGRQAGRRGRGRVAAQGADPAHERTRDRCTCAMPAPRPH